MAAVSSAIASDAKQMTATAQPVFPTHRIASDLGRRIPSPECCTTAYDYLFLFYLLKWIVFQKTESSF